MVNRLRAVGAVFWAGTGLDRLKRTELHASGILVGLVCLLGLENQGIERQVVEGTGLS